MCKKLIKNLIDIYDAANSLKPTHANQGQAMDGFSELRNYREIIKEIKKVFVAKNDKSRLVGE
jgi:hypothetical protein